MTSNVQRTIYGYELGEQIGRGGFGAVYRAVQRSIPREVAIKVILSEYTNRPDFIRRFESEAQLVARLEHAHIVPLYDFWRDAEGAYLVMRFLRGGNLSREVRQNKPYPADRAIEVMDQLCAALMVAHRQGVIHRDIKPDNVLLDNEGDVYLTDFGIAKDTSVVEGGTETGAIVGSLPYMAPELFDGAQATIQSDVYSLGVMLYEMLVGTTPFSGISLVQVMQQHRSAPVPLLGQTRPDLNPALDEVISRAMAKQAAARFATTREFAVALRSASRGARVMQTRTNPDAPLSAEETVIVAKTSDVPVENPYKGLRPFDEADAADFFGRASLVERLTARVGSFGSRFLAVVGPSGSGKSSVVRAGLLPALRRGAVPSSASWFYTECTPGAHPFEALEVALLRVAVNPPATLLSQLREDSRGLLRAVGRILPNDSTELFLLIDQFEELFTLAQDGIEQAAFLESLREAVSGSRSRLHIVLTLRADFYDRPLSHPAFGDLMRQHTEVVLPMSEDELGQAVSAPAKRVGLALEPGLESAIISDIKQQPGALPLLQFALSELYEQRRENLLTLDAYRTRGGVAGALIRRAGDVYTTLDEAEQKAARQLFLRLVNTDSSGTVTRRRVLRAELEGLVADPSALERAVDGFSRYRLLTLDNDPVTREPTVEVAHEALITAWTLLKDWLATSRSDLEVQRRISTAASEWRVAKEVPGYLASGERLMQFEDWARTSEVALNTDERAFLSTSIAQRTTQEEAESARKAHEARIARQARTFGRAAAIFAVVGVLAVFATLYAVAQASQAAAQVVIAGQTLTRVPQTLTPIGSTLQAGATNIAIANFRIAQAGQTLTPVPVTLTAVAEQVLASERLNQSLQLAEVANRILQNPSAGKLPAVLIAIRALRTAYNPAADSVLAKALQTDYERAVFASDSNALGSAVAFSPDDQLAATGNGDGTVFLWQVATRQMVRKFLGHKDTINALAFSPDGKTLLSGSLDQTIRTWDTASGKQLLTVESVNNFDRPFFAPDGQTFFTSRQQIDARTGAVILDQMPLLAQAISPDGRTLAGSGVGNTAVLVDLRTQQVVQTLNGHTASVAVSAFSPDGSLLVTGSRDNTVKLWDVASGRLLNTFQHEGSINGVEFSTDGRYVVTACGDGTARLWNVSTGQNERTLGTDVGVGASVLAAALSHDGHSIVTVGDGLNETPKLWMLEDAQLKRLFNAQSGATYAVAFATDGRSFVTGTALGAVTSWSMTTGQPLRTFSAQIGVRDNANQPAGSVYNLTYTPDGRTLIVSEGNYLKVYDAASGSLQRTFENAEGVLLGLSISSSGRYAVTGGQNKQLVIWELASGRNTRTITDFTDWIYGTAFAPDEKRVAGAGIDGASVWDAATGTRVKTLTTEASFSIAYSPDGRYLAVGRQADVDLWDTASWSLLRSMKGHTYAIRGITFSPDSRLLISSGFDGTARLWNVETGANVRTLLHNKGVQSASFSPNGKYVVTASLDGAARLWDVDYHDFIDYACRQMYRDISRVERRFSGISDNDATCPQFVGQGTPTPAMPPTTTPLAK